MTCGVYEIVHVASGKRYVGSSVDIEGRWKNHLWRLNKGDHHSPYLQRSWNKYGSDAFSFSIISVADPDRIHAIEQLHIDEKAEYNVAPLAGSSRGHKWTDEQKAAHKESKIKYYIDNPDAAEELSKSMKVSHSRPSVIKAISEGTKRAQQNPVVRMKMSDARRKQWQCPGYRSMMTEQARRNTERPDHKAAIIAANTRPRNNTVYFFAHAMHGIRKCTQWELKNEFPELRSNNLSQLCSGVKKSHAGWTMKKAPEGA